MTSQKYSVKTYRNFNMSRGFFPGIFDEVLKHSESNQNDVTGDVTLKLPCLMREFSNSALTEEGELEKQAKYIREEKSKVRSNSQILPEFGLGGFGDKSSLNWSWPLGSMKVKNSAESFSVKIPYAPFNEDEISAYVISSDLFIVCSSEARQRYLHRLYQLPINVDPLSVHFRVTPRAKTFTVGGCKTGPLQLKLATATERNPSPSPRNFSSVEEATLA